MDKRGVCEVGEAVCVRCERCVRDGIRECLLWI